MTAPVFDIHRILKILPHRYPILLVDRVLEFEKDVRIKALKNVTINEPFFNGHFPARPVMPGVLTLEALAQAAALLSFESAGTEPGDDTVVYFVGIDGARFKRPVEPGDQLILEARIDRARATLSRRPVFSVNMLNVKHFRRRNSSSRYGPIASLIWPSSTPSMSVFHSICTSISWSTISNASKCPRTLSRNHSVPCESNPPATPTVQSAFSFLLIAKSQVLYIVRCDGSSWGS